MNFLLFVTPTEVTKLLSSKPFIVELLCSMDEHTQLAMALSLSMMDNKEQGSTAINLPTEEPAAKPKKRSRKKKKTDEDLDEHTRIAMAMSASLADETKQKNKDLRKNEERPGKKPRARAKGKLKKVHQEFPVLLTRQDEERQKILAERISDILESSRSEDFISSEHVFRPSRIGTKYLNPDSRPLTETYPGNIKIKSGLQLWDASGVDLSKKQTGKSPFYVEQLQPNIVPLTPKNRSSPTPHQVSIRTPCKQSPKSAALDEASVEESMSMTQSLGMTVQCLAELAEEGLQDSMSLSSDKCGFIPQEIEQRAESPENRLSDDQITLLEELSSLVNSRTMSDAVIQIDDGSKLHVHSFMIQLRCPALAALLAKSLGRNNTSLPAIVVSDIGYEAMENVLSYIYSANITITNDTASEINRFAERFEMAELASHCKPYLQDETVSNAAPKKSELDIVDKDLNQLIDSLWEDEDEEKENEKHGDAGRTSDDDMDETLNDDEIKEICDVVSSQGVRSRTGISDNEDGDVLARNLDFPRVSSPKKMENTDDGEMRDEDSEEEEVMNKMMLTQGCRRSDSGSYSSRRNVTDGDDDEDWSMALEDEVILQGEANTPCVSPLAKGMTDEVKEKIGENLQEFRDIADNIPEKDHRRRRKVDDSSSSGNDTITDEPNNRTLEESIHSLFDETLVPKNNTSAASMADDHKPRQTSPENLKITIGGSKDAESCHGLKVLHERMLDDRVDRSESPDDEVLLLRTDSAESANDGQSRNLRKSQQSLLTGIPAERFRHEEKESSIDDTGQRRGNLSKRKKLLIQQYSPQSDSDDSHPPLDLVTSCHGDEIQVIDIEEKKSEKDVDGVRMPSLVLKKLSVALALNRVGKDSDGNKERLVSQSSSTEHPDSSTSRNRLDSLDGSLSEDILSPSPPPSPRFTRASQIPRVEKMVEDRRSPVNMNSPSQWNHCRSLNASPSVREKSLVDEDDPYELSTSSSASSGNGRKQSSSCKRKKLKKVKRERRQCGNADNLSSPRESNSSSKDTKRRWSTLRRDHDLPSRTSRDAVHCEAQVMLPHKLSPSPTSPDRISLSPQKARSPASVGSPALGASPVLSRSPAVSNTPAASRSPGGSCRESPYSAMQDMDDMPEERFAFDMEEGCGFDDFCVEMDPPHDDIIGDDYGDDGVGDDAEMTHQVEKVVDDEYHLNGNGETSKQLVTGNHQDDQFEEEHEIDLTQEGDEEEEEVEEENKEEDGLMDSVDHHSPVLRGKSSGSGYPLDVSHREPEEGGRFKNFGTPHVNHSQRPLLDEGPIDKSNGHHKLPQSSRTTPRTSQSSTGAVLRTPLVSRLIEDEYFPPAPITPMPNYDSMLTPELKKELKRFGVKPLSKKKARLILTQIFSYLHQVMPEDESDDDTSSTAQTKPEPGLNKGRSRKGKTAKPKTTKRGPAQKNQTVESSSDDRPTKEKSSRQTKVAMKRQTKPRKRKKEEEGLDETPTKRAKIESHEGERGQDITRRGVETEESTGLDELASSQDSHSSSFDSNKSDFGESIYHDDLEDDDDVMATQQVQDMSTDLSRYITSNKELHQKILNYEVLSLEDFYKELKEAKVKCSKVKLAEFLDHHCITFRHKEGSRQRKPKNAKAKR